MSKWFEGDVQTNGIRLHYHRSGGDKPVLVLSHGVTDNGLCWTRLAKVLEKNYDLIMVDARGHGNSDAPESGYSSAAMAEDLAGLIVKLGLQKPGLIGHSMGAMVSAYMAAHHPNLAGRLVLEDPPWHAVKSQPTEAERRQRFEGWKSNIEKNKTLTVEEITATQQEKNPKWDASEYPAWSISKTQVAAKVAELALTNLGDYTEICPRLACPTLLVTGDPTLGAIVTAEVAAHSAKLNPRVQVAHIGGAGHNIRREQFDAFVKAVTSFLS